MSQINEASPFLRVKKRAIISPSLINICMRIQNITYKDYTIHNDSYQLVLLLDLKVLVAADDSVRMLSQVLDELDYHKLMQAFHVAKEQQLRQEFYLR